jgi:hypothetical protein
MSDITQLRMTACCYVDGRKRKEMDETCSCNRIHINTLLMTASRVLLTLMYTMHPWQFAGPVDRLFTVSGNAT